ncbi:hypothetical protein AY578_05780 [Streptomyces thermocarboxydus]|uniref:hypothetical protein n=1 Tax=Streptomyces thermocarboxydus TaxID=59299 RepID=UPI00216437FA|nr:hypothetical protein AY578_05780 [Streptomyces thermocarboxydus]
MRTPGAAGLARAGRAQQAPPTELAFGMPQDAAGTSVAMRTPGAAGLARAGRAQQAPPTEQEAWG